MVMPIKILVVEDDHVQASWIVSALRDSFHNTQIEIVSTELEFRSKLPEIVEDPPDVVVMDVMLRWADPTPAGVVEPPEEIKREKYYRAGLRCQKLLSEQAAPGRIPVVFYTVLSHDHLAADLRMDPSIMWVAKSESADDLIKAVRSHLAAIDRNSFSACAKRSTMRNQVFISYSHKDIGWLERLQVMLKPLVKSNSLTVWDDRCIKAGTDWREQIEMALRSARLAVLLVSPDFLASDFIAKDELPPLLEAAAGDEFSIIPVFVRPSLYKETVIEKYQAANKPSRPLAGLSKNDAEEELVRICSRIKEAVMS
jgi:DNA-binding NarL/FixJ family response regulator